MYSWGMEAIHINEEVDINISLINYYIIQLLEWVLYKVIRLITNDIIQSLCYQL